jgi:phosphoribosylamine---glycine ligase
VRFLLLDPEGLALDVALLAQSQGHAVTHFVKDKPSTRFIGENVVKRIRGDLDKAVMKADVIFIADNSNLMHTFDKLREITPKSTVWIGPTKEHARWESDRKYGQDLLDKYGIPVAPYKVFSDYDAAIAYVQKRDTRLVSKPFGSDQDDKSLTYVAKSPEDMVYMLKRWQKLGKLKQAFMLQEFVKGVEFGIEAWFDGEGWSKDAGFHESFEHKKFMAGDIGPSTGEQGTCNAAWSTSAFFDKILAPLTEHLRAHHYCGFINLNCIIADNGKVYPLEFTCRPGWPCFQLQVSINKGDFVENLYYNRAPKFRKNVVTTGVVLAIPDYPYSHLTGREVNGIPIFGFEDKNLHHHPYMAKKDREVNWVTAGDNVCTITGHGATIKESADNAYANVSEIHIPNNCMYRNDISYKLEKVLPKLQRHGYGLNFKFK